MESTGTKNKVLKEIIKATAFEMGFNSVGFVSAEPLFESEKKFLKWREEGLAGDMNYLLRDNPINARPTELFKEAKTIIVFTVNYFTPCPPRPSLEHGRIAAYAVGFDYHKVIKKKLKELVSKLKGFENIKIFTDAVPLLEKSFAKKAGLGFKGKNTMLISKENGSFNFIAEILTDIEFEPDPEISKHNQGNTCGTCVKCIDICPTDALINDHQIDARKCISYLTIENKSEIQASLAKQMGEWFYGCDLCQTICPYNSKSLETPWAEFQPESGVGHWLYLPEILMMDPAVINFLNRIENNDNNKKIIDLKNKLMKTNSRLFTIKTETDADKIFHEKFCRTPLTRAGRKSLIRNAMIAALNSRAPESQSLIKAYLEHPDSVLKSTANFVQNAY